VADPFEPFAKAIRDERTRVCSGLIKLRHKLLGKAHATRASRPYVSLAYDEAATMVAGYIHEELGRDVPVTPQWEPEPEPGKDTP
jgi:hypothetical protein